MTETLTIIYIVCGLLLGTLGAVAFIQNPNEKRNRTFLLLILSTLSWMSTLYAGFSLAVSGQEEISTLFFRLSYASGIVFFMTLCEFIHFFPHQRNRIPTSTRILFLLGSGAFAIYTAITPGVYSSIQLLENGSVGDQLGPLYSAFLLYALGCYLFTLALLYKKIIQSSGVVKKRLIITFSGLLSFVLLVALTNAILPAFDIIVFQREAVLFSLLFLVPAFYSLYKHRFFNLSYTSLNLTRHILLLLAFSLTLGITLGASTIISPNPPQIASIPISALCGLLVYLFLNQRFPELVSDSYRHFRKTIYELQAELYRTQSYEELEQLLQHSLNIKLNIRHCQVFLVRKNARKSSIPIYREDALTKTLQKKQLPILITEELKYENISHKVLKKLKQQQAAVCFPLRIEEELVGLFFLGTRNHDSYGQEEITLLQELRDHLEVCFVNLLFKLNLRKENSLLQQAIAEKTKTLRDRYNRTKNLLKNQSEYFSMAVHEIKNPLNTLSLQLETSDLQTPQDREIVNSSVERMMNLTQSIFESQQYDLNSMSLNLHEVSLQPLIQDISMEYHPIMKQHRIRFQTEFSAALDLRITIDETKITQVLTNLLNNAIKFTPAGGTISLGVHETSLSVVISVSDSGPGIADKRKQHIFEKFNHGDQHFGLGMGLYLCKKIIQLHQGSIHIANNTPSGSIFSVSLRKDPTTAPQQSPAQNPRVYSKT